MAIALSAVGVMLVGWVVVGGGFGPRQLGAFASGFGVVVGTIFAIGFLRQTPP